MKLRAEIEQRLGVSLGGTFLRAHTTIDDQVTGPLTPFTTRSRAFSQPGYRNQTYPSSLNPILQIVFLSAASPPGRAASCALVLDPSLRAHPALAEGSTSTSYPASLKTQTRGKEGINRSRSVATAPLGQLRRGCFTGVGFTEICPEKVLLPIAKNSNLDYNVSAAHCDI